MKATVPSEIAAAGETSYTIRLATADDIARLAELRHEFRSNLATPVEDRAGFLERCEGWMRPRLGNGNWHCWVAEEGSRLKGSRLKGSRLKGSQLIGNVWIQIVEKIPTPTDEPEEHAYLTNFFVLASARGRGVGSEMMTRVLEWSARENVHAIFLWPTDRTRALYERHGFRADGDVMQMLFAPRAK